MATYTILGGAKSGIAAATLALRLGHSVFLSEYTTKDLAIEAAKFVEDTGIDSEFGGHTHASLESDILVVSPGIKPTTPILLEAEKKNIPIISELEFASQYCKNPIIAITGTNGKTTTTALTEHVLRSSGRSAIACGNIGTPLSSIVLDLKADTVVVAETSSYQLDRISTFKPKVAVILNITPDHLGYHGSMENYINAKWKISQNQSADDVVILCADNLEAASKVSTTKAQVQCFSMQPVQHGMYIRNGILVFTNQHNEEELMHVEELSLPGVHNCYNSMAAALSARVFELRNENIRDALVSFLGVEHRLEAVRTLRGVEYVNDSKATNVNATWYALQSYSKPIILLAGGLGDANDYSALDEAVRTHVRTIIAIGDEQDAIFNHFCAITRCIKADSLESAVLVASKEATDGEIVLFSPACKSFDMFMNFEHRGDVFKHVVHALV